MVFNTQFLAFIQGLKLFSLRLRRDDDFCDRLNHHNTALFILITSILIGSKQYVGNPIHCWVPKEFSATWQKYADNYCWIKNTYIIPPNEFWEIPKPHERRNLEINYYQWVPIVLMIQSLLFYFPTLIWRILNWTLGVNLQELVSKAMDAGSKIENAPKPKEENKIEKEIKSCEDSVQEFVNIARDLCTKIAEASNQDILQITEKVLLANGKKPNEKSNPVENEVKAEPEPNVPGEIKDIAHHLEVAMESVSDSKSGVLKSIFSLLICNFGSRKYGCYLVTLYLLTKILYIINVVGQLFLLNSFIGTTYKFFGFQILNDLVKGNDWKNTGHFPRVTMCDFEIRNLGQRTNYTVQCVLPINLFNEKVYIFIWFWIFFVAILTIYSFFHWIVRMSFQKTNFIKGLLQKGSDNWSSRDNALLERLIDTRLKSDGVFLIYLVYLNAGDLVTKELLDVLWFRHKQKHENTLNEYPNDDTENELFL